MIPEKYSCIKSVKMGSMQAKLVMNITTDEDNFSQFYNDFNELEEMGNLEVKFNKDKMKRLKTSFSLEPIVK